MRRFKVVSLIVALAFMLLSGISGDHYLGSGPAFAESKPKVAVLGKVSKEQSARRFEGLFPISTHNFIDAFTKDGRFEVMPLAEVEQAMVKAGVSQKKLNPDDAAQLRAIGREAGADLVFISYYYEMGGHGMPMHSNNVLILVRVATSGEVKLDRDYSRILSESELVTSDANGIKELLQKAESL